MLSEKIAVIYGAGGAIGGAIAQHCARAGARVFLAGRRQSSVEAVAQQIGSAATPSVVDVLDEGALAAHMDSVADAAGRIDIVCDAIGFSGAGTLGTPLLELGVEEFFRPTADHLRAYFQIAQLAARHMVPERRGVIFSVSTQHARMAVPLSGGFAPAMAAKEALTRALSAELSPHGLRVFGLRPQAVPETRTLKEAFQIRAKALGITWEQFLEGLASKTHPKRLMTLEEIGQMAAFLASDAASGVTGTTVNLTLGCVDD